MDRSPRRHSSASPVVADLTAAQELSRSESESESERDSSSTVENSKTRLHQTENLAKDCLTAWTNEKHNLYLDHLESSFVEQLHRSTGILAWYSENNDLKRSQHIDHETGSLFVPKKNPRFAGRRLIRTVKLQNNSAARDLCKGDEMIFFNETGMSLEKSLNCIEEFSDQNFADESSEHIHTTKRSKTIVPEIPNEDQTLPMEKPRVRL